MPLAISSGSENQQWRRKHQRGEEISAWRQTMLVAINGNGIVVVTVINRR